MAPRRRRKAGDPVEPKVPTSPCYLCQRSVPRHKLVIQQMIRGARGQRHSGHAVMCGSCAAEQQSQNQTIVIMVMVGTGLVILLFWAVGVPLNLNN